MPEKASMKLRSLSTMRDRRRYIVFELISKNPVKYEDMKNAVWNSIMNFLGENDTSRTNIHIIKNLWNQKQQTGFIRCSNKYVDHIKVALSMIHQIGDEKVIFYTKRVFGTIKSAKNKTTD